MEKTQQHEFEIPGYIKVQLGFDRPRGAAQLLKYGKKANEYWANVRSELIQYLVDAIEPSVSTSSHLPLVQLTKAYSERILSPELVVHEDEAKDFISLAKLYGTRNLIEELFQSGEQTTLVKLVGVPALAAADGLGDVSEQNLDYWMNGVSFSLPLAADLADKICDKDYRSHKPIEYDLWGTVHKLVAAGIFKRGEELSSEIKTGDQNLDNFIVNRLKSGVDVVSSANRLDIDAQKMAYVSRVVLDRIYPGKICEIEGTVFDTIPSKKRETVGTLREGAWWAAFMTQGTDDLGDLLGDPREEKPPRIPRPSYFLTFAQDAWKTEKDVDKVIKIAVDRTFNEVILHSHSRALEYLHQLPKDFGTVRVIDASVHLLYLLAEDAKKKVLQGTTFPDFKPELESLLNV